MSMLKLYSRVVVLNLLAASDFPGGLIKTLLDPCPEFSDPGDLGSDHRIYISSKFSSNANAATLSTSC